MVAVAFGKKELAGGWPLCLSPADGALWQTKEGSGKMSYRENSFIYIKEALHLCMDIYMHGFPARLIFFIHMLIQVQALQNTKMDSRDYII